MFGVVVVSALVSMVVTRMTISHYDDNKKRFQNYYDDERRRFQNHYWHNNAGGYPPSTPSFPNNGQSSLPNSSGVPIETQQSPQNSFQQFSTNDRPNGVN